MKIIYIIILFLSISNNPQNLFALAPRSNPSSLDTHLLIWNEDLAPIWGDNLNYPVFHKLMSYVGDLLHKTPVSTMHKERRDIYTKIEMILMKSIINKARKRSDFNLVAFDDMMNIVSDENIKFIQKRELLTDFGKKIFQSGENISDQYVDFFKFVNSITFEMVIYGHWLEYEYKWISSPNVYVNFLHYYIFPLLHGITSDETRSDLFDINSRVNSVCQRAGSYLNKVTYDQIQFIAIREVLGKSTSMVELLSNEYDKIFLLDDDKESEESEIIIKEIFERAFDNIKNNFPEKALVKKDLFEKINKKDNFFQNIINRILQFAHSV